MKSTKRHFTLENGEYLITVDHPDAHDYKIFLDGKEVTNVLALIRDSKQKT